jgi:DHA3 family tetracycline resistance protein-like MFS transporter
LLGPVRDALRHRDFRLLFTGQAVSAIGDQLFPVAVTVQVLDHGGTVGDLGLVLAARTAALVLFALLGGVWADRLPRVRVLIFADALRLVAVLGLVLVITGTTSVLLLSALVFFVGAGEAFFRPAFGALIPSVLPADELNAGNALSGSTFHMSAIVGPGLAGVLVALSGPRGALLVDAGSFAFSLAMLVRVREPARVLQERQRVRTEMAEGLRAVRDRPWIAAVLLMAMTQLLLVIPACSVLLPVLVKSTGSATASYGYVLALGAVGGLIGAVVAGHVRPRLPGLVANLTVMLFVLEPLMLLLNAPAWGLVLGWFLSSFGLGPFLVYWETALQRDIPPELLARVISIDWMCSFALMPLGLALVGPAVGAFGRTTVLVVAVVAAAVPPLLCLPVPGMLRFRTPTASSDELAPGRS